MALALAFAAENARLDATPGEEDKEEVTLKEAEKESKDLEKGVRG